jgi:hypothetical protein
MAFRYACFISYRHATGELMTTAVDELYKALTDELEAYVGGDSVYCDKDRLNAGEIFPEKISNALYRSVCMIAVYTPTYFDKEHTYCAREFKAMEMLEKQRLERLKPEDKNNGLIIPIVFRGLEHLPREIKQRRHYSNFENFLLCDSKINRHPLFAPAINKIAKYIDDRYDKLVKLGDSLFDNDDNFKLPEEKEIMDWLKGITKHRTPLSWREESTT